MPSGVSDTSQDSTLSFGKDRVVPVLTSAGVVGTMPNIPANRLNSQFDFGGASISVSAGEKSSSVAFSLAARSLQKKELDAALVCAVDLSCEPLHVQALAAVEGPLPAPQWLSWSGRH